MYSCESIMYFVSVLIKYDLSVARYFSFPEIEFVICNQRGLQYGGLISIKLYEKKI